MTNISGPLELSDNPARLKYKPDSAVTDGDNDESLHIYGGTKLLEDESNKGLRNRKRNHDSELVGNTGLQTDSDSEGQGRLRDHGENSSDEGLVSPKKVSNIRILVLE